MEFDANGNQILKWAILPITSPIQFATGKTSLNDTVTCCQRVSKGVGKSQTNHATNFDGPKCIRVL